MNSSSKWSFELKMKKPFVVGIDVGGTKTAAGIMDLQANLIRRAEKPTDRATLDTVVKGIANIVHELLKASNVRLSKIAGIGVGIPGQVDIREGTVVCPISFKWREEIPLKHILQGMFNVPVIVDNDVNVAAYGEKYLGAGVGIDNLVYITIGTGIAAAIIMNGELYRGANGGAGELGHTSIDQNGPECSCGSRGCVESIVSGPAMEIRAKKAIERSARSPRNKMVLGNLDKMTAKTVFEAGRAGDPLAIEIIERFNRDLGLVLVNIVNLLDPEVIIIGGGIGQALDLMLKPLNEAIKTKTLFSAFRKMRIVSARLGVNAGLIGAGILVREAVLGHKKTLGGLTR